MVNAAGIGVVWANLNNTVDDLKQTQRELADRKERQKIYQVTMDGMNTQIGQIAPLQYQQSQMLDKVSENKTSIAQTSGLIASFSPSAASWIRSSTPSTRSLPE
jgi:DNA repair ATPase RecN